MKLALMLGGMAAGRRAGGPGELLSRGTKLIDASPELSRLVGEVRGRLLEAGKGAVVAVATRQVESLTDRVGKRVEALGETGDLRRRRTEKPGRDEPEHAEEQADVEEGDAEEAEAEERDTEDKDTEDKDTEERATEDKNAAPRDTERARATDGREEQGARRASRAPAANSSRGRGGRSTSGTATVRRTASGAGSRKPRARRGEGDG
ncbi:hypothetical protein K1T35_13110 [Pseudonocardia sp. DSM 110487]|uniref:hypothetical protein n=1 Tax=Pseudonocardia sp. DSM 110487 TaxID=2865833 RepID=UPI001C6A722A|nr:hypothetical protein [Pseudonocardia sp. DSM 110487]QYN38088.1 hypothetical protein K1T35_13110 [Pseudonocardia sp. DSM 110487]